MPQPKQHDGDDHDPLGDLVMSQAHLLREAGQHVEQAHDTKQVQREEQRQVTHKGAAPNRPRGRYGQDTGEDQEQSLDAVTTGAHDDGRAFAVEHGFATGKGRIAWPTMPEATVTARVRGWSRKRFVLRRSNW